MSVSRQELELLIKANGDQLAGEIGKINKQLKSLDKGVNTTASVFKGAFASQVLLGGLKGIASGIAGIGSSMIQGAAQLESYQTAFSTMLGSMDKAEGLMGDIREFAASTPFQFEELAGSTKSLLAFGTAQQDIIPTMQKIGDIASGVGAPIQDLATLYGKAQVAGTLYAEDINQLTERGIPIIQEFAKQMGVSEAEVKKLASEGKITFPMLQQAFTDLTAEGGQFNGMMEAQSQTFGGLMSTLQDNMQGLLVSIGTPLIQSLKPAIDSIIALLGSEGLTSAISTLGSSVGNILSKAFETLGPIIEEVAPILSEIFDSLLIILEPVGELATILMNALSPILNVVVSVFSRLAPVIARVVTVVSKLLTGLQPLIDIVLDLFVEQIDTLMPLLEAVVKLLEALTPVIILAANVLGKLTAGMVSFINFGLEPVIGFLGDIVSTIGDAINGLTTFFGLVATVPDYKRSEELEKQISAEDEIIQRHIKRRNLTEEQLKDLNLQKEILAGIIKERDNLLEIATEKEAIDINKQYANAISEVEGNIKALTPAIVENNKKTQEAKNYTDALINARIALMETLNANEQNVTASLQREIAIAEARHQLMMRQIADDLKAKKINGEVAGVIKQNADAQLEQVKKTVQEQLDVIKRAEAQPLPEIRTDTTIDVPFVTYDGMTLAERAEFEKETWKDFWDQMDSMASMGALSIAGSMGGMFNADDVGEAGKDMLKQVGTILLDMVQLWILSSAAISAGKAITSFGATLITDAPWLAALYMGAEVLKGYINSLAVGTTLVPQDQIAQIHKGEMIVPRPFAEGIRSGEVTLGKSKSGGAGYMGSNDKIAVDINVSRFEKAVRSSMYKPDRVRL